MKPGHWLRGVLLAQSAAPQAEVEENFQQVLVIAYHQDAKSLTLLAAMSSPGYRNIRAAR